MMLAGRLPEMAISLDEANRLAVAFCNYARHSNTVISQKNVDLIALIGAVGMIEGTRLFAVISRKRRERQMQAVPMGAVPGFVPSGGAATDAWVN
jgi:hypothetical protein